jgi:hypothetical protein
VDNFKKPYVNQRLKVGRLVQVAHALHIVWIGVECAVIVLATRREQHASDC